MFTQVFGYIVLAIALLAFVIYFVSESDKVGHAITIALVGFAITRIGAISTRIDSSQVK